MACMVVLQAQVAVTVTPKVGVAATGTTQVTFTSAAIASGLTPNTDYSYTLDLGAGAGASSCIYIGKSASVTGALVAMGPFPSSSATYTDSSTPYTATVAIYLKNSCPTGAAPSTGAVVLATGSAKIRVRWSSSLPQTPPPCDNHAARPRPRFLSLRTFSRNLMWTQRIAVNPKLCYNPRPPAMHACRRTRRCC